MANTQAIAPDEASAQLVEEALVALQSGIRVTEADRYLTGVRASSNAWRVCAALVRNGSESAMLFAARTVYMRVRADWYVFEGDVQRVAAFELAVRGIERGGMSAVHLFGRACGFCVSMSVGEVREGMWKMIMGIGGVRGCAVLGAVVEEIDAVSTTDVDKHVMIRAFCREKVGEVLKGAVGILGGGGVEEMRAAVRCIHGWNKYGEGGEVVLVLVERIGVEGIADDVAECLNEMIGFSGANVVVLERVCEGLIGAFGGGKVVDHAIAEVVCALSDGNADELVENERECLGVVKKVLQLLWMCLRAEGDDAFFAAVEGWGNWLCAANMGGGGVVREQVGMVVETIVERMERLKFVEEWMENREEGVEKGCVIDFLLEAAACLGVAQYVKVVLPFFDGDWRLRPRRFAAALLAFKVAAEDQDVFVDMSDCTAAVLDVARRILYFVETAVGGLRTAAMTALCSFATVLTVHGTDNDVYRALRCATNGMLDAHVGEQAAAFLKALTKGKPRRLRQFLPELVTAATTGLNGMTNVTAANCIRAIATVVGVLPSHVERLKAMEMVLEGPCKYLLWVCSERKVKEEEENVCRGLHLITAALQEVNDNDVSAKIFGIVRAAVFEIAIEHCANGTVSKEVCDLLEASVLPTLMDDYWDIDHDNVEGDDRKERMFEGARVRQDGGRLALAMSCMSLAAECFRRSGQFGQACWMVAIRGLAPHVLDYAEGGFGTEIEGRGFACLSMTLQHCLEGLQTFTGGNYDSQADMTSAYFRFVTMLLSLPEGSSPIPPHVDACARIGLAALHCQDLAIVRESLNWWKSLCSNSGLGSITTQMFAAAGGADAVARGMVCAARHTRCAGSVADALFILCKWVAKASGESDPQNVLRSYLARAFANGAAPGVNLDTRVREMVYRSCVMSAGSKRDFKQALKEFGRICALAM